MNFGLIVLELLFFVQQRFLIHFLKLHMIRLLVYLPLFLLICSQVFGLCQLLNCFLLVLKLEREWLDFELF